MKVHEKRAVAHAASDEEKMATRKQKDEEKMVTRKKKAEREAAQESPKKAKTESGEANGRSDIAAEFDQFCEAVREHLSIQQMRDILEANDQDSSVSDDAVVPKCQDILFYGQLDICPACSSELNITANSYSCKGAYSEWSTCTYSTRDPPRKEQTIKLPKSVLQSAIADMLKDRQEPKNHPQRERASRDKPFSRTMISLAGRLSQTHQYWKLEIEKHGGKVSNSIIGVTCLVVSPAERERGGSSKVAEAVERGITVVSEAWLIDSIEKQEAQPLHTYDVVSDLAVEGRGIPWEKQDPSEEAIESFSAELKLYGKRGVHKDSKLQDQGGKILERDGILFNCAFSLCDKGWDINELCIMQLITVPNQNLHMYYKKGKAGDSARAEEKLEEWENVDEAIKEFARIFEGLTGNELELWEREKKIQKQPQKFFPIDTDDGVEVRHGGLGLRQLGVAVAHCKLDPMVANFIKVLCSQEIYRYALMEMGLDPPDLPLGMLTDLHLKRCEETLQEFLDKLKITEKSGPLAEAIWTDFSQRWFTLLHSTRPFIFRDYQDLADHGASVLETVRDINVASRLIGDMSGSTIDDPLSDRYKKLGCSIAALPKDSDDYKMIVKYLEKTYEPVRVGEISYGVSVENIFAVELISCPSLEELKSPNKFLLWCGSRSSNLLRHLQKGFLPAICSLPVPGYMFGRAIFCSDAAAEAARYEFTAVDRPEGFLVLAVASMGEQLTELTYPPEDTKSLEEKKVGVKGLGRKKTNESEHFMWKGDIKVPCGRLVPSEYNDSLLEYNEYAVYDPKQVSIQFLVGVKYEEKDVDYDMAE